MNRRTSKFVTGAAMISQAMLQTRYSEFLGGRESNPELAYIFAEEAKNDDEIFVANLTVRGIILALGEKPPEGFDGA